MQSMKSHSKQKPSKNPKAPKTTRPAQPSDDFVSVARRLECDEDKAAFEAKLAKIAKVKPKAHE